MQMPHKVHGPCIPIQKITSQGGIYITTLISAKTCPHFSPFKSSFNMSPKSKFAKPSPILMSKIPRISKLYEELGIRNAPIRSEDEFVRQIRNWRKTYHTRSGQCAADLINWNNRIVQSELNEVAEKFFEEYGESYWSANVEWDNRLSYTDDKLRSELQNQYRLILPHLKQS